MNLHLVGSASQHTTLDIDNCFAFKLRRRNNGSEVSFAFSLSIAVRLGLRAFFSSDDNLLYDQLNYIHFIYFGNFLFLFRTQSESEMFADEP